MAFSNPYASHRTRRKSHIILPAVTIIALITYFHDSLHSSLLQFGKNVNNHPNDASTSVSVQVPAPAPASTNQQKERIKKVNDLNNTHEPSTFIPTLRDKKIFFEVVTVGLKQFSYLEEIIDSVRDMCEAGAHVSFHITSSNCNPHPNQDEEECPIRNQSSEETEEDNFNIETIDHLNERVRCRNPEGSLDLSIHLVSPDWGKQIVNHHRLLFYENIDEGYDVFVHTEDDTLIRPTTVLSFMHEMEKVRLLVGNERLPDYSIGFMRYENEIIRDDRRRVTWEFEWDDEVEMVSHPGIEGLYFISPPWHHQGMFMATKQQLSAWKSRGPDCHFDKIKRRPGYHTERISGALDLYDEQYCNVTQLLPLDSFDDLLVRHLPNKNNQRSPKKIKSLRDLHKMRMQKIQEMNQEKNLWVDTFGKYDGINMLMDERVKNHRMHFDLTEYNRYVKLGGRLTKEQLRVQSEE